MFKHRGLINNMLPLSYLILEKQAIYSATRVTVYYFQSSDNETIQSL